MFDGTVESIKLFFSTLVASGVALIGASFKYIIVLTLLMIIDTAFGWVKAKKIGKWKSGAARWGFIGKIIELMFVGVLYLLDAAFNITFLEYMGIFYFGACELASIVENYAEINENLPEGTIEITEKIKFSIGTVIMQKLKKIINGLIGDNEENDDENKN